MSSGQNNAACRAVQIKAVLSGNWIERAEIGNGRIFGRPLRRSIPCRCRRTGERAPHLLWNSSALALLDDGTFIVVG
jgi:hypothetical protein